MSHQKKRHKSWKEAERCHIASLDAGGSFELGAFTTRMHVTQDHDSLLAMYVRKFMEQRIVVWRQNQIDQVVTFLGQLPGIMHVSFATLFVLTGMVLSMLYTHPCQLQTDSLLLHLLSSKFTVDGHETECQAWFDFLSKQLMDHQAGATDLRFYFKLWKSSHQRLFQFEQPIKPHIGRTSKPRPCHWFCQAPIALLEIWLQRMESQPQPCYFKLDLPTFDDLVQRVGHMTSPVRLRMLQRAYRVCCTPLYMCWYNYGTGTIPQVLERILFEAPLVFYHEPNTDASAASLLQNVQVIPTNVQDAFVLRNPPVLQLHSRSIVLSQLYLSEIIWTRIGQTVGIGCGKYLPRDIIQHLIIPYFVN